MTHSPPGVSDLPFAVDAHAHVFDLERYPLHPSSGFDLLANEPGTARQYSAVLDAHGLSHALWLPTTIGPSFELPAKLGIRAGLDKPHLSINRPLAPNAPNSPPISPI